MISLFKWKEDGCHQIPSRTMKTLRHTLGSSTRMNPFHTGSKTSSYSNSERNQGVQTLREGVPKRVRIPYNTACDSEKKLEPNPDTSIRNPQKDPFGDQRNRASSEIASIQKTRNSPFKKVFRFKEKTTRRSVASIASATSSFLGMYSASGMSAELPASWVVHAHACCMHAMLHFPCNLSLRVAEV